jgi:hypothetical protein
MRRFLVYWAAAAVFTLALVIPAPHSAQQPADRCAECQGNCQAHYDQCQAVHGITELRCDDQFNACIVRCFRNFCEQ